MEGVEAPKSQPCIASMWSGSAEAHARYPLPKRLVGSGTEVGLLKFPLAPVGSV